MSRTRVLCFPPVGAGPSFFNPWAERTESLDIVAPDLPGKERRFTEPPVESVTDLIDALRPALLAEGAAALEAGEAGAMGLFGHCFGALLAFEAARVLEEEGFPGRLVLLASGSRSPGARPRSTIAELPEREFVEHLRDSAGYAHPALDEPELRELILPVLRADVIANESYADARGTRLRHLIVTIRGRDDALVTRADATAWADHTTVSSRHRELPGGHMYLLHAPMLLDEVVRDALATDSLAGVNESEAPPIRK